MTAKEKRACMVSFLLHNEQLSSTTFECTKERPPFFFVGTVMLNGKLGDDQVVIRLPLWPLLKHAGDMEEAVEQLITYIMSIQEEGPYLLGGNCNGSFVAFEIARRLASRGHRVDLLALVEAPGIREADRLFVLRRRLLFAVMRPAKFFSYRYLTGKLRAITRGGVPNEPSPDLAEFYREFDRVFGDYTWVRLRSGSPTYLGRLTLLYGDTSIWRYLATHGWKKLVKGGIDVHVAKGNHSIGPFGNPGLIPLLQACIQRSIRHRDKHLEKTHDI